MYPRVNATSILTYHQWSNIVRGFCTELKLLLMKNCTILRSGFIIYKNGKPEKKYQVCNLKYQQNSSFRDKQQGYFLQHTYENFHNDNYYYCKIRVLSIFTISVTCLYCSKIMRPVIHFWFQFSLKSHLYYCYIRIRCSCKKIH